MEGFLSLAEVLQNVNSIEDLEGLEDLSGSSPLSLSSSPSPPPASSIDCDHTLKERDEERESTLPSFSTSTDCDPTIEERDEGREISLPNPDGIFCEDDSHSHFRLESTAQLGKRKAEQDLCPVSKRQRTGYTPVQERIMGVPFILCTEEGCRDPAISKRDGELHCTEHRTRNERSFQNFSWKCCWKGCQHIPKTTVFQEQILTCHLHADVISVLMCTKDESFIKTHLLKKNYFLRECAIRNCKGRATCGLLNGPAIVCSGHSRSDMINQIGVTCRMSRCKNYKSFGYPQEIPLVCRKHALSGMVKLI